MGCEEYKTEDATIKFDETDESTRCLCTFPYNDNRTITPDRLRSLALLGAAVVLANRHESDFSGWCSIPNSLPAWVDVEICKVLNIRRDNNVVITN